MKPSPERKVEPAKPRRRPYRAPELVVYGSIAARTLSNQTASFPDTMKQMATTCY